ncbi:MAG: hypothetical protein UT34_C0001G0527 [candidate division WS6 bacterium GW2011_GWF2_39_15]|uniref:Uncharacterized protein n=1 Tax=candidate division WS6 bacterium GW2011_GWF2_39_15 TaxID=1619100 RepID=A0A0G0N0W5_9BACT|nr:MAG: hypothetical protein UT34_C0001G0527 [candidate division WS6 bacterium GW2011_GWF2_39_15]
MKQLSQKTTLIILGSVLVFLVIAVILLNPGRRLADERNNIRLENLTQIVEGVTKYASKNNGVLPKGIPVSDNCEDTKNEICRAGAEGCDKVALSVLVNDKYMEFMPTDPQSKDEKGTGYNIVQSDKGRITLCAPSAELGKKIVYIK